MTNALKNPASLAWVSKPMSRGSLHWVAVGTAPPCHFAVTCRRLKVWPPFQLNRCAGENKTSKGKKASTNALLGIVSNVAPQKAPCICKPIRVDYRIPCQMIRPPGVDPVGHCFWRQKMAFNKTPVSASQIVIFTSGFSSKDTCHDGYASFI